jgi:hypothetical protein
MKKSEINAAIISEARVKIEALGLQGKLDIFPVSNTCTYRPRFWKEGGTALFKVLMWTINGLTWEEMSTELDSRISEARQYFGI